MADLGEVLEDNLKTVMALLVGVLFAALVALTPDTPAWAQVIASLGALAAAIALLVWVRDAKDVWRSERRRRVAVLTACAMVVALGLFLGEIFKSKDLDVDFNSAATILLLDASGRMEDSFDGATKFATSQATVNRHAVTLTENQLGLVTFGSGDACTTEPAQLRVVIGRGHGEQIRNEVDRSVPGGGASLVEAARFAISLLEPFTAEARVIIVAGGVDECGDSLEALLDEIEFLASDGSGVVVQWDFVGIGLSDDDKVEVQASDDVNLRIADTEEELDAALEFLLFEQPVRNEFELLESFVTTEVRSPLNDAIAAANRHEPQAVYDHLDSVDELVAQGDERFTAFLSGESPAESAFGPIKDLMRVQFDLLAKSVPLVRAQADFDAAHASELADDQIGERNELVAAADGPIGEYNRNLRDFSDLVETVLGDLFG